MQIPKVSVKIQHIIRSGGKTVRTTQIPLERVADSFGREASAVVRAALSNALKKGRT